MTYFFFSAPYPTRDNFPCANEQQGIQGATKICQGASGLYITSFMLRIKFETSREEDDKALNNHSTELYVYAVKQSALKH